jgi:hypothetical protein
MTRKLLGRALLAAALGVSSLAGLANPQRAHADPNCPTCPNGACDPFCLPRDGVGADLFYNFYARPACAGVPAEMYPAPYPTPPLVGHTYYTYQPLMPHEMLYRHHRTYRQYYNYGRGMNRTMVRWW